MKRLGRPALETMGLVHTVRGPSGHVSDIGEGNTLLHGQETVVFGDAGYRGIDKRPDAKAGVMWHMAMKTLFALSSLWMGART